MQPDESYLLITRYLARQTTLAENEQLAAWVAESAEHEQTFEQLKRLWQASQPPADATDTAAALRRVQARLTPATPAAEASPTAVALQAVPVLRPKSRREWAYGLAVLGLLMVALGVFFYPRVTPATYTVQRTRAGQQLAVRLPDGSQVTLAPQSQLRYPAQFAPGTREVYLVGEALFQVQKDARRPFRVHSGEWVTQVLGTTFNVSAFGGAATMAVSLLEGRVQVQDRQQRYLLAPGQQLLAEHATGRIYRQPFRATEVLGWQHNRLQFRNQKLADVAPQLERLYGVKLVFEDAATAEVRLWATFDNEPLPAVLAALHQAGGLRARQEGRVVYLHREPGPPHSD